MQSRVMRVNMARWHRHMDGLLSGVWFVCCDAIRLPASMATIVLAAILAGAGFGWGLAMISVWK